MEIKIHNLKKTYGSKTAVDIPDYTLQGPEILGLMGNNGAGKTTLFRLMLDLLKADRGNVCLDGTDVSQCEDWKSHVGAYMDESFLIDYLTPEEYFQFCGRMYGFDADTLHERIYRYERFLGDEILKEKKYIRNLSAGNKQKTGIVTALLHNPELVILDEPFNFLDPTSQSLLKHLLKRYCEEQKATILVSSHNLSHTVDLSTRIVLLEQGHLLRDLDNTDGAAGVELENYFEVKE